MVQKFMETRFRERALHHKEINVRATACIWSKNKKRLRSAGRTTASWQRGCGNGLVRDSVICGVVVFGSSHCGVLGFEF